METEASTPEASAAPRTPAQPGAGASAAPVTPSYGADGRAITPPASRGGFGGGVVEAELKFKIGRCHLELREWRAALAELETIPSRSRSLPITLALGKTYQRTGYERAAVACFKECLRQCPYATEAYASLAAMGTPEE